MTVSSSPSSVEQDARFLSQLIRHEGSKRDSKGQHIAYRCSAGALTIGYGHNLDAHPIPGLNGNSRISDARAREILADDLAICVKDLDANLPWWRALDTPRQAVILNMAFNLGAAGLLTFKITLSAICDKRWDAARNGMLDSKWAGQVGYRAAELAEQMLTGEWQGDLHRVVKG